MLGILLGILGIYKAVKPSDLCRCAEFRRLGATAFLALCAKKPPLYCPPHRRDCVNGIYTDSLDLPHTWPSHSDTLADCHFSLRTDAQLPPVIFNEKAVKPSDLCRCAEFRRLVLQPSSALHPDGFRFISAHAHATLHKSTAALRCFC